MTGKSTARLAGLVYFVVVLTGIYNLIYVPSQLIVSGDAAATVANIKNSELLFRSGIVVGIISYVFFLILPFVLYRLFESVNRTQAALMVILAAASVPISILNIINKMDVLTLLSGNAYLEGFSVEQINAQIALLLESYNNGLRVLRVFWGLWLFPFGYLAYKSGYLPRIFGISLMLGCVGYSIKFVSGLLFPEVSLPGFISIPSAFGEIGICLWLLIMGVNDRADNELAKET